MVNYESQFHFSIGCSPPRRKATTIDFTAEAAENAEKRLLFFLCELCDLCGELSDPGFQIEIKLKPKEIG